MKRQRRGVYLQKIWFFTAVGLLTLLLLQPVVTLWAQTTEEAAARLYLPLVVQNSDPSQATESDTLILGAAGTSILGDEVWTDTNANGIQDIGERGVAGVTVTLLTGCSGTTVAATRTTNVNGTYLFGALDAGQYRIQATAPAGFIFSPKDAILDDDYDSDVNAAGISDCVTLAVGEENYRVDVGLTSGVAPTPTNTPPPAPTNTPTLVGPTNTPTPIAPTNTPTPVGPTNTPPPSGTALIGDRVWNDLNVNGVQDIGERGVANVTLDLLAGCSGVTVITGRTTNVNGAYSFANLAAGQYRVRIVIPSGFSVTFKDAIQDDDYDSDFEFTGESICITLLAGEQNGRIDAGITQGVVPTPTPTNTPTPIPPTATPTPTNTPTPIGPTATPTRSGTGILGDRVWNDVNVNGVQDIGEPGVAGVTVDLLVGCTGTAVAATRTTNANGSFTFSNLADDQYRLRVTRPSGYSITIQDAIPDDDYDSDMDANGVSFCITLGVGEQNGRVDAGITQGVVPTPTPTPTRGPVACPGNLVTNGSFESGFANWQIGSYTTAQLTLTNDAFGGTQAALLRGPGGVFISQPLAVIPGAAYTLRVYGKTNNGAIFHSAGLNFYDNNSNRVGQVFARVTAGVYQEMTASIPIPAGVVFAEAYLYTDGGANYFADDLCVTSVGGPTPTPTPSGNSTLGDRIWNDLNTNGVQDIGERGLANVRVDLLSTCNGATVLQTRQTNSIGTYLFANIASGQYRIRVTTLSGYNFTLRDAISDDQYDSDVDSSGVSACITLAAGQENYDVDAGLTQGSVPTPTNTPAGPTATPTPLPTATPIPTATPTPFGTGNAILGDRVWSDTNANGVQDIGERGVAGVTVELLTGCSGTTVVRTRTTNSNGDYLFSTLPAGQYRIRVVPPAGRTFSPQDAILDDDYDSDVNSSGVSSCVTLGATEENYRLDTGLL